MSSVSVAWYICVQLLVVMKALTSILQHLCASSPDMARAKLLQEVGRRVVMGMLTSHLKSIYHCLRTVVPSKLIGACLRFLTAMVMQGAEPARKLMMEFNFSYKPLGIFVNKNAPIPVSYLSPEMICVGDFYLGYNGYPCS